MKLLASRKAEAAWRWRRQQRLDPLPERVGHKRFHGSSSSGVGDHPRGLCSCARAKRLIVSERSKGLERSQLWLKLAKDLAPARYSLALVGEATHAGCRRTNAAPLTLEIQ